MRSLSQEDFNQFLQRRDPKTFINIIEEAIELEKINLQIHQSLHNKAACIECKHRIADCELLILVLRGYLPS